MLRTSSDWETDVPAQRVLEGESLHEFELEPDRAFIYYKPVRIDVAPGEGEGSRSWSVGQNYLAQSEASKPYDVYPYFSEEGRCSVCDLRELTCPDAGTTHQFRVFYPPGYEENVLKRYPVLYMQDGQNLFFPHEAFGGAHWRVPETLTRLNEMNLVDKVIVVGIYPEDRMRDYTAPGYDAYAKFITKTLKPAIDAEFRTLPGPTTTSVMGSSLGGVVSLHLAWRHPEIFGSVACLSSTFGYRDDLFDRVESEGKKPLRIYLDTGWPRDNYEVTRTMRTLLARCGFEEGTEMMYLAFPWGKHDEGSWALRSHIPFQFLFGRQPHVEASGHQVRA
ncbi:MAG: alpha/beta hydrolase-fold protein [Myxococcota bacterium]